ncbi:MAG: zinc metallopeptidase [Oscillospiraceae bacterium]|nr:zinc metallopeptidase [Oscillospiraceae bacterium]
MFIGGFYGMDIYFLMFVVPALLFSIAMQIMVKGTYKKMSAIGNARHLTGAQTALRVLEFYGVRDVRVERVSGRLSDHYDPRTKTIRLSDGVFGSATIAAVGIAAHEAGHAAQHANSYMPIKIRNAILPVCNIGSSLGIPLVILGYLMSFDFLITVGLALYALIALFQLVTLPVEFNASRRALHVIESQGLLEGDAYRGAKKVLTAAAMTYVAALVVSIANLLRFMMRFQRRR